jgi:hypothetical protein
MSYLVFLSHSNADKPAVEELARRLAREGIQAWLDKWHLIPGDAWQPASLPGTGGSTPFISFSTSYRELPRYPLRRRMTVGAAKTWSKYQELFSDSSALSQLSLLGASFGNFSGFATREAA